MNQANRLRGGSYLGRCPNGLSRGQKTEKTKIPESFGPARFDPGIPLVEASNQLKRREIPMIAIQYGNEPTAPIERRHARIQIDIILSDLVGCFLDDSSVLLERRTALAANNVNANSANVVYPTKQEMWCRAWDL
jgi:hypothetical protein